jgi:hypothetical protein
MVRIRIGSPIPHLSRILTSMIGVATVELMVGGDIKQQSLGA